MILVMHSVRLLYNITYDWFGRNLQTIGHGMAEIGTLLQNHIVDLAVSYKHESVFVWERKPEMKVFSNFSGHCPIFERYKTLE
jgi:hypothetical protein